MVYTHTHAYNTCTHTHIWRTHTHIHIHRFYGNTMRKELILIETAKVPLQRSLIYIASWKMSRSSLGREGVVGFQVGKKCRNVKQHCMFWERENLLHRCVCGKWRPLDWRGRRGSSFHAMLENLDFRLYSLGGGETSMYVCLCVSPCVCLCGHTFKNSFIEV